MGREQVSEPAGVRTFTEGKRAGERSDEGAVPIRKMIPDGTARCQVMSPLNLGAIARLYVAQKRSFFRRVVSWLGDALMHCVSSSGEVRCADQGLTRCVWAWQGGHLSAGLSTRDDVEVRNTKIDVGADSCLTHKHTVYEFVCVYVCAVFSGGDGLLLVVCVYVRSEGVTGCFLCLHLA